MRNLASIQTKKLFLLVIIVKIVSSLTTLFLSAGRLDIFFWALALIVPMIAFATYIYGGLYRIDRTLTDEKFADSCYYLGFIFTIVSIVISLFDLPNIGDSMSQISVRFGVAMVSTAVGLLVRVYLINFKIELNDAVDIAETALINGAAKFTEQLSRTTEKYALFENSVNASTNNIIEHINQRIEKISQDHAVRLENHFKTTTQNYSDLCSKALNEINNTSKTVQSASNLMKTEIEENMRKFSSELEKYAQNLREKLNASVLPSDFFSSKLESAIEAVKTQLLSNAEELKNSSNQVSSTTKVITDALSTMSKRSTGAIKAIESMQISATNSAEQTEQVKTLIQEFGNLSEKILSTLDELPTSTQVTEISNQTRLSINNLNNDFKQSIVDAISNISNELQLISTSGIEKMIASTKSIELTLSNSKEQLSASNFENIQLVVSNLTQETTRAIETINLNNETLRRDFLNPIITILELRNVATPRQE
jgi:hypothetical protein